MVLPIAIGFGVLLYLISGNKVVAFSILEVDLSVRNIDWTIALCLTITKLLSLLHTHILSYCSVYR